VNLAGPANLFNISFWAFVGLILIFRIRMTRVFSEDLMIHTGPSRLLGSFGHGNFFVRSSFQNGFNAIHQM